MVTALVLGLQKIIRRPGPDNVGNAPVTCDIIAAILFYLRVTIVIGVILTTVAAIERKL